MIKPIITDKGVLAFPSRELVFTIDNGAWELTQKIILDLTDTALSYQGKEPGCAGLAANQIGYLYRIFIIWDGVQWVPMINPVISFRDNKEGSAIEGCLSRPGIQVQVKRHKRIRVKFLDSKLKSVSKKYSAFTARVIQHENDHLDGKFIS